MNWIRWDEFREKKENTHFILQGEWNIIASVIATLPSLSHLIFSFHLLMIYHTKSWRLFSSLFTSYLKNIKYNTKVWKIIVFAGFHLLLSYKSLDFYLNDTQYLNIIWIAGALSGKNEMFLACGSIISVEWCIATTESGVAAVTTYVE